MSSLTLSPILKLVDGTSYGPVITHIGDISHWDDHACSLCVSHILRTPNEGSNCEGAEPECACAVRGSEGGTGRTERALAPVNESVSSLGDPSPSQSFPGRPAQSSEIPFGKKAGIQTDTRLSVEKLKIENVQAFGCATFAAC